jgi:4-amino-4-deoxy-L-arabinose transferase-like glycosyltransferase
MRNRTHELKAALSRPENLYPILLFLAHLAIGAGLGLSDDEAYHWVLAQRPAMGYAFHPPGMAWMVFASRMLLEWLLGPTSVVVVRIPAALTMGLLLALSLRWIRDVTGKAVGALPALGLLSFAGLFSLGWMLVPDTPLFLGWMIAFYASWYACAPGKKGARFEPWIAAGVAIAMLGKYSGVHVAFSVAVASLLLAPKERKLRIVGWATLGGVLALVPIIAFNARHEWGSILYQVRDRHEDHAFSLVRYSRFWLVSLLAAGPMILAAFFGLLRLKLDRASRFIQVFALPPALIYLIQPLWSDFKVHWAFVVWWPAAILFSLGLARAKRVPILARVQLGYGLAFGLLVVLSCYLPIDTRVLAAVKGSPPDPRLDVTNDFYGWTGLSRFLTEHGIAAGMPVVGGRYQTAAQAAFALGDAMNVSRVPRDLKARDEWAILPATDGYGPSWPRLRAPVLFVADIRYDAPPEFPGAKCSRLGRLETRRGEYLAKWVDVWRCEPAG